MRSYHTTSHRTEERFTEIPIRRESKAGVNGREHGDRVPCRAKVGIAMLIDSWSLVQTLALAQ